MTKNTKREKDSDPLPLYECHPPVWVPSTHRVADLGKLRKAVLEPCTKHHLVGYPGFHPPHPSQDEHVLSESNIKSGFSLPQYVQVAQCSTAHRS